ncbi:multidrug ABC transporter ATP-binding protein [Candidatus Bathyarchaeota archaeon]|nr:MAG: multidrug ABC transporter ATP-binding protein [Candidatus Bathyarchaeota archaeon]
MGYAIQAENLTKTFGSVEALKGASFNVKENEIFGLIGHNGAGKTTTLRILSTLISPTNGSAKIFGYDVSRQPEKVRQIFSYLPEEAGAYQQLNGIEFLEFMAGFYAKSKSEMNTIVEQGKLISDLGDRLNDRVKGYSKGMLRRLLIARALMMKPKLAILDEPTSGLDVIQSVNVRNMIKSYADQEGVSILLSSHNMLEVEYLCHKVALINQGIVVAQGSPEELKAEYNKPNLEEVFMEVTHNE